MTKGIWHGSVLVALCLSLGACDGAGASGQQSLEQTVPAPAPDMASNPSDTKLGSLPRAAVAALPGEAGSVASVHDRAFANGFRQDIDLAGGAVRGVANGITVFARTSPRATLDEATPMFKPTEPAIRSELAHTFPHIAMQVVERPSKNAYGPYGLAIGRSGATVRCLYAWQWIDQRDLGQDAGLTGPVALRVRLCRADATFDDLAALVDRLSIHPGTGQDVADAVAPPDAAATKHAVKRRSAAHRPKTNVARTTAPDREAMWAEASTPAPTIVQPLADDLPPQAYAGPKGHVQGQQN